MQDQMQDQKQKQNIELSQIQTTQNNQDKKIELQEIKEGDNQINQNNQENQNQKIEPLQIEEKNNQENQENQTQINQNPEVKPLQIEEEKDPIKENNQTTEDKGDNQEKKTSEQQSIFGQISKKLDQAFGSFKSLAKDEAEKNKTKVLGMAFGDGTAENLSDEKSKAKGIGKAIFVVGSVIGGALIGASLAPFLMPLAAVGVSSGLITTTCVIGGMLAGNIGAKKFSRGIGKGADERSADRLLRAIHDSSSPEEKALRAKLQKQSKKHKENSSKKLAYACVAAVGMIALGAPFSLIFGVASILLAKKSYNEQKEHKRCNEAAKQVGISEKSFNQAMSSSILKDKDKYNGIESQDLTKVHPKAQEILDSIQKSLIKEKELNKSKQLNQEQNNQIRGGISK